MVLVAGCGPVRVESTQPGGPTADDPVGDFSGWPTATAKPYRIDAGLYFFCAPPTPERQKRLEAEQKRHGPHHRPSIVVRTNPAAIGAFRAGRPMPAGAVVVKEKHWGEEATGPPVEYAAMVKRDAGYDPDHGDWEYVHVVAQPERQVTRGRLESCINCHATMRDKDYLFRTYLQPAP